MSKKQEKFEVCPRCEGRGKIVNPSIDGHGLSQEDFDQDPDFEEAYFAGRYDIACTECRGLRVVDVYSAESYCCGEPMRVIREQEYPGAYVWTSYECRNPKCTKDEEE